MAGQRRVPFRRERSGETDYRQRRKLIKGRTPLAVFRRSNRALTLQLVKFDPKGDRTLVSVNSAELKGAGLDGSAKSATAAYLAGRLFALRAKAAGVERSFLHLGRHASTPGSRLYAALRGAREGGLDIPADEEVLPDDDRFDEKVVKAVEPKLASLVNGGKR
ncbi:MAG: 50S ribosomal protein L18 [Halobacteria archaeon]